MSGLLGSGSVHLQGRYKGKVMLVRQATDRGVLIGRSWSKLYEQFAGFGDLKRRRKSQRPLPEMLAGVPAASALHFEAETIRLKGEQALTYASHVSQEGHWTYECKNAPVYHRRPSRSQQLHNPKVKLRT